MTFHIDKFDLEAFVRATLSEDMDGPLEDDPHNQNETPLGRDVTSQSVIPADAIFSGVMDSRDENILHLKKR